MEEFGEWLRDNTWSAWLSLAVILGVAEMASLDLVLAMLAVGALGGAATSLVTDLVLVQVLVAIATALGMLALVRPNLVRRLHTGPELRLGHTRLIGAQGSVTREITALSPGEVKVSGETWTAQPYDETLTIAPGETVEVLDIRGATAYVHPIPRLEP
jgi:membrane protein implicated in regulation of membrane protease activity